MIDKRKYEKRARGHEYITGKEVNVEWGNVAWDRGRKMTPPYTNGETIVMPDGYNAVFDDETMMRSAFNHEMAHIMFTEDFSGIRDWASKWSSDKNQLDNDPYNIIYHAAKLVANVLEDQRIEHLYGRMFYGSKIRFEDVFRNKLNSGKMNTPGWALHAVRCGRYNEVKEKWGEEYADFFWEKLKQVEDGTQDAMFYTAEEVMRKIYPWYRDFIIDVIDDEEAKKRHKRKNKKKSETKSIQRKINEKKEEKRKLKKLKADAQSRGNMDRAEELEELIKNLEEEIEELEGRKKDKEEEIDSINKEVQENREEKDEEDLKNLADEQEEFLSDFNESIEDRDYEPPEEVMEGGGSGQAPDYDDEEFDENEFEDKIEKEKEEQIERLNEFNSMVSTVPINERRATKEAVEADIVEIPPNGAKKGKVYENVVQQITNEMTQIYARKHKTLSMIGDVVEVDEFVESEIRDDPLPEIFRDEISEVGFTMSVLLDLSGSMRGSKMNMCRNIGCTLMQVFNNLEKEGIPMNFSVYGFGGTHQETMIRKAETIDDIKRMSVHDDYTYTPTWNAIHYVREDVSKKATGIKMLLIVTDGVPGTGFEGISSGRALSYTRHQLQRARGQNIYPFTVGIYVKNLSERTFSRVYGPHVNAESVKNAGDILLGFTRNELRNHIMLL